ncbi:MAG: hypothetical protein C0524_18490 [Rhodobacter sp.]|nr:hypothetical protein [Rhodobacter sp.]
MTRPILSATLLCLWALPALSQTPDCANTMVQYELNICAEMDWQEADDDLNRAYKEVMAEMKAMDTNLPPELQGAEDALRSAQRAWIDYRDANCSTAGFQMRGGSAERLVVYGCLRQMTLERTEELRALVAF